MTISDVFALLEANKNERGMRNWEKYVPQKDRLKSFGIGLTVLRKLAKQIGRDRALALELWESNTYDARVLALLIDDPKQITREQAESQVEQLEQGMLAHVFSTCDATLAKAPFVVELTGDWIVHQDSTRRRCGYGLLYELSKSKKKSAPDDAFFLKYIHYIDQVFPKEEPVVHLAMGHALMGMGMRNRALHAEALPVARRMGPIPVETGVTKCDPFDVVKHLTGDYATKKFGLILAE